MSTPKQQAEQGVAEWPPLLSTKLLELKALIEVARSSLLDAVIMTNELFEVLASNEGNEPNTSGALDAEPHCEFDPSSDGLRP